eukprot:423664-Pelagomonas_calceolata.AAC.1
MLSNSGDMVVCPFEELQWIVRPYDGSSLLHALKDRPRTTHAHTLAHMEAGRITQNVEETGKAIE